MSSIDISAIQFELSPSAKNQRSKDGSFQFDIFDETQETPTIQTRKATLQKPTKDVQREPRESRGSLFSSTLLLDKSRSRTISGEDSKFQFFE